jgi:hypothetical protein
LNGIGRFLMRRVIPTVIVLAVLAAACGGGAGAGTEATTSSTAESTTEAASSTSAVTSTTETATTSATTTTTFPEEAAVDHSAYCVRGTDPSDTLNVRSGPGTGFDVVGELAWNAVEVPAGGYAAPDDQGRPWYQVAYDGGLGWSAAWYLEPAPCTAASASPAALTGAGLPPALSGGLVPWFWVGEGWTLALYAPDWSGPRVLYLLSPYGDTYEVFSWSAGGPDPYDLYDWRPDGKAVLVRVALGMGSREIRLLDLSTRASSTVLAVPELGYGGPASFTRPTGRDLVYATGNAATEIVEVRHTDGTLFSTLMNRPRPADGRATASWLYGLEGTTVVVGDGTHLTLLSNLGAVVRTLDAPGEFCMPARWWDASTVLVRCIPPEVYAVEPNTYYGRLWLVPLDGTAATALTALPSSTPDIVDFGYSDAMRSGGKVFAQWTGDCGAAGIWVVASDGSATGIAGNRLIGFRGGNLVVQQWSSCDGTPGSLALLDPNGTFISNLIPPPVDAPGVMDALMLRDLG